MSVSVRVNLLTLCLNLYSPPAQSAWC